MSADNKLEIRRFAGLLQDLEEVKAMLEFYQHRDSARVALLNQTNDSLADFCADLPEHLLGELGEFAAREFPMRYECAGYAERVFRTLRRKTILIRQVEATPEETRWTLFINP